MTELQLSVDEPRWSAGTTVTVETSVSEPDAFRSVSLLFVMTSRINGPGGGLGKLEPHVLARVPVDGAGGSIEIQVPADLPGAFDGTLAAWSYELRLIGDRSGRDAIDTVDIEIVPTPTTSHGALGDRCTSAPLTKSVIMRWYREESWTRVAVAVAAVAVTIAAVWFAIFGPEAFDASPDSARQIRQMGWISAGIMGITAVFLTLAAVGFVRRRYTPQPSLAVKRNVVEPGDDLVLEIDTAGHSGLACELVHYELALSKAGSGGASSGADRRRITHQRFPVDGGVLRIPTSATGVRGFPGRFVATHWVVGLVNAKGRQVCANEPVDVHG